MTVLTGHVVVPPRVCAMLAKPLADILRQWSYENGGQPDADVATIVEEFNQVARSLRISLEDRRNAIGTSGIPSDNDMGMMPWMTTAEAAEFLQCTERNVTELCKRGSLHSVKVNKRWRVFLEPQDLRTEK